MKLNLVQFIGNRVIYNYIHWIGNLYVLIEKYNVVGN